MSFLCLKRNVFVKRNLHFSETENHWPYVSESILTEIAKGKDQFKDFLIGSFLVLAWKLRGKQFKLIPCSWMPRINNVSHDILYYQQLSIAHYQVNFYGNSYFKCFFLFVFCNTVKSPHHIGTETHPTQYFYESLPVRMYQIRGGVWFMGSQIFF